MDYQSSGDTGPCYQTLIFIGGQVDIQFKYIKLTFNVIEFQCNGLDPTVKSWGTANHVKIWDGKKSKTIDCGKKRQPPYYSTSDEIQVQLQVRTYES